MAEHTSDVLVFWKCMIIIHIIVLSSVSSFLSETNRKISLPLLAMFIIFLLVTLFSVM